MLPEAWSIAELGVWVIWLLPERGFLGVVYMSVVAKCSYGRRGSCQVFGVTSCHVEDVSTARVVLSSEGVTSTANTFDIWRTLVGLFADDAKQNAGRSQFRKSRSALSQHVAECSVWFAHSKG